MLPLRHSPLLFALLFTAGSAVGQSNDVEWMSYRDAYRTMVRFDKYGEAKHLIQQHLQVVGRDKSATPEGLQLTLQGKTLRQNLPLDATGRALFPVRKAAYDENASLLLNRPAGQYQFRARVSIVIRPDGVYDGADLRVACEQALAYQRLVDSALRASKCSGVRFVFNKDLVEPGVRLRKGEAPTLPPAMGPAFQGDAYEGFRVVSYKLGASAAREQVVTQNVPLAITPEFD
ncbi:MAG TPA: hypothetical protein VGC21_23850 [Telluria sp.]|jgi:hypothetical protein